MGKTPRKPSAQAVGAITCGQWSRTILVSFTQLGSVPSWDSDPISSVLGAPSLAACRPNFRKIFSIHHVASCFRLNAACKWPLFKSNFIEDQVQIILALYRRNQKFLPGNALRTPALNCTTTERYEVRFIYLVDIKIPACKEAKNCSSRLYNCVFNDKQRIILVQQAYK